MIPQLPLKLEHAIREVTAQVYRQRILQGRFRFGCVLLGLIVLLGVAVEALVDSSVPLALVFVAFALAVLGSGYLWLWLPRRRDDIQRVDVARFLDAHHPELEDLVLSSVSLGEKGDSKASEWMVSQVLATARALSSPAISTAITNPKWMRGFQRKLMGIWAAGLATLAMLILHWGAIGLSDRLFVGAPTPLPAFDVAPGDVRVRVGDHQLVWVTTDQKNESKAIRWRNVGGQWETMALEPGQGDGVFAYQLRHLLVDTDYQVQIGSLRSAIHRISVWTPPEVVAIDLTYRYPDYLKMPDRVVPHGGDIVVPEGTQVQVDVLVNKDIKTSKMMLESGRKIALSRVENGVWRAVLAVNEDDRYKIVLQDLEDETNAKPRDYKITAQADDPPNIRIRFPRGDDEATPLEEVSFGFVVKDDYGVFDYGLQYEVAGRDPVWVSLKKGDGRLEKIEDAFLLALEDAKVAPGDFVTWTIWADDGKPGRDGVELLGDPYFLEIRPFARFYRQAISNGGQQQGQAGGQPSETDQKQVIIATWNLRKKAKQLSAEAFEQHRTAVIDAQKTVQNQAMSEAISGARGATLVENLDRELTGALTALNEAVFTDPDGALARALAHEQRAYRLMLQLKPQESQVTQNRRQNGGQQGGGQRGGQQSELDGLELAHRRDFREEASTVQQQLAEATQARNQIEDLTRRQAAINEDMARLISEMQSMEEAEREEAKRRLAQLQEAQQRTMESLDQVNGEMASGNMDPQQARQAREQLETAREQMNRSAQNLEKDELQQARAAGNRALGALRDVQEQLTQLSRQAASERMQRLQAGMDSLRAQQQRLVHEAEKQQTQTEQHFSLGQGDAVGDLLAEKRAMEDAFKNMMDEASDLAEKSDKSQTLMSQNLGDWLRETSREGIYEEMVDGERFLQDGLWDSASEHEKGVLEKLDTAAKRLNAVAGDLVRDDLEAMERALERVRGLANEAEGTPQDASGMRDFAAGGFREWMDDVREAQALLPEGNESEQQLGRIRDGLAGIGRDYQRAAAVPQYDLVFDEVIKPLQLVAEALDRSVRAQRDAYGFSAESMDAVPEAYRNHVAEYFKALAEMDETGARKKKND